MAGAVVANESTTVSWELPSRIALVRYTTGARLEARDGVFLVDTLRGWVGADGEPFGILADAAGLGGTDGPYRSYVSRFFSEHRAHASIALINVGPVIHIVVEMFRIGTGIPLKVCASDGAARAWLRGRGLAA